MSSKMNQETPSRNGASQARILVVDDNATARDIITRMLRVLGIDQIDSVPNGDEALECIAAHSYDLVMMDLRMPRMDGLTAARKIRENSGPSRDTPIIALTADVWNVSREDCLAAGMDDYLAKPVFLQHLAQAVDRWLFNAAETAAA